jgi:hypothetical protein
MKMKKILNEWKKFTLNEARRGGVDDILQRYLGTKVPDGWFNLFNRTTGDLTDRREWFSQLDTPEIKNYIDSIENPDVQSGIRSGLSFHIIEDESGLLPSFADLIELKAQIYMNTAPEDHVQFLKENFDGIFEYAKNQSMSQNRGVHGTGATYGGNTAFAGSAIDYLMFGDLISETEDIFRQVVQPIEREGGDLPPPPSQPSTPPRQNDRMSDMMAAMQALQRGR